MRQRDFLVGAYLGRLNGSAQEVQIIPGPEVALLDGWEGLGSSEDDNSGEFFGDDEDKLKQPKRQPSKNNQPQVPQKVPRKQPEVKNMNKQSVSPAESDFDSENEELLQRKAKAIQEKLAKRASLHPAPKATPRSVLEDSSGDFGGADEEQTQRSKRRGSSKALDPDECLAAMAKGVTERKTTTLQAHGL